MEELTLEQLAMGELPTKMKDGKKPDPVSNKVLAEIKRVAAIVDGIDGKSVKDLKKLNPTELKALLKAYDKTQDALYRAKEMVREAMPKSAKSKSFGIAIGSDC